MDDNVIEVERPGENQSTKKANKKKRNLTSTGWNFFEMFQLSADKKQRCKCKNCETIYFVESRYGIGNLKRIIDVCIWRDM